TDTFLRKIKSIVKNFEYYKEYKKEIDFILKPNLVLLEKEKVNYNILNGWKLSTHKQPTKKELLSEKQLQEKSLVMDLDKLMSMISIYYNHDTNIEQFVQAIKQRVVAMKWKLKNRYYFFGLKNGIEDFIVRDGEKNYYYGTEQIITKKDYTVMDDTFNRMVNKWIGSVPAKMKQNKIFYIGLPYSMRIKQDIKSLVKFIHTFENNKENKTKININSLVDDLTNKNKESGLIYQIYIKDDELEKLLQSERSSANSILTSPSSIENIRRQIENLVNERGQLKVEEGIPDLRTKTTTQSSSPVLQTWNSQFISGLSDITVTDNNNEENEDDENDEEDEELY
ncbi:MAG TPA: hypothetical protein VMZ91_00820, partial [Candidatus Paceibacterota bacterium]|nr:hypothetical protein [Candidatus Paceibacterota bacterium]